MFTCKKDFHHDEPTEDGHERDIEKIAYKCERCGSKKGEIINVATNVTLCNLSELTLDVNIPEFLMKRNLEPANQEEEDMEEEEEEEEEQEEGEAQVEQKNPIDRRKKLKDKQEKARLEEEKKQKEEEQREKQAKEEALVKNFKDNDYASIDTNVMSCISAYGMHYNLYRWDDKVSKGNVPALDDKRKDLMDFLLSSSLSNPRRNVILQYIVTFSENEQVAFNTKIRTLFAENQEKWENLLHAMFKKGLSKGIRPMNRSV